MIPLITQQKLDAIAEQYGAQLMNDIQDVLNQPQFRNSGELAESLKLKITKASNKEAPKIIVEYAEQGFFIGYKSPRWTSLPKISELEKWAETKTFSFVPGYSNKPNIPEYKIKERIVWAIAKDKRKNDTWKQKKWKKAAGLGDVLKALNTTTMQAYVRDVETILADAISTGTVLS